MAQAYPLEVRKDLMHRMVKDIRFGASTARIMDSGIFPAYLSLISSANSGIGFFLTEQMSIEGGTFSIHLEEPSICNAFHRWLLGFAESRYTLGAEDTIKVILEMMKE